MHLDYFYRVDPWIMQGVKGANPPIKNLHITLCSALHVHSSVSADSPATDPGVLQYVFNEKFMHMSGPRQSNPLFFKGQLSSF